MTLKTRLKRLEEKRADSFTVFITRFATKSGESEIDRAVIIHGKRSNETVFREVGESDSEFEERIESLCVS